VKARGEGAQGAVALTIEGMGCVMQEFVQQAFASIVGSVAVVAALWKVVGYALDTAVKQRAALELADRKEAFDQSLEDSKQAAQRMLEQYKAQLTLDAEVRKQVAARKVDLLLRVVSLGQPLVVKLLAPRPSNSLPYDPDALQEYFDAVRAVQPVVSKDVASRLIKIAQEAAENSRLFRDNYDVDAFDRAVGAVEQLLAIARQELFIEVPEAGQALAIASPSASEHGS
jgi:hypothetical protein